MLWANSMHFVHSTSVEVRRVRNCPCPSHVVFQGQDRAWAICDVISVKYFLFLGNMWQSKAFQILWPLQMDVQVFEPAACITLTCKEKLRAVFAQFLLFPNASSKRCLTSELFFYSDKLISFLRCPRHYKPVIGISVEQIPGEGLLSRKGNGCG